MLSCVAGCVGAWLMERRPQRVCHAIEWLVDHLGCSLGGAWLIDRMSVAAGVSHDGHVDWLLGWLGGRVGGRVGGCL